MPDEENSKLFGLDTMNAPWGLDSRLKLVALACRFFNANNIADSHAAIGNRTVDSERQPGPLNAMDFLKFLETTHLFPKIPNAFRVARILGEMVDEGFLISVGQAQRSVAGLGTHYLHIPATDGFIRGPFQFAPVLGPEFIHRLCTPGLVHISGADDKGDVVSGTGLVIDSSHVLTCGHLLSDMKVDERQIIQEREYGVNADSIHEHPEFDVAVLRVEGPPLSPISGLFMQAPVVGQTVYTLGYPKLPGLRDASVTMQQGAVTNESVTSLAGQRLFLYSAIARPGNSGGPVMSKDGYLVGLSVVDVIGEYNEDAFSPHYAGIPAQELVKAVKDLGLVIESRFVNYE